MDIPLIRSIAIWYPEMIKKRRKRSKRKKESKGKRSLPLYTS